MIFLHQAVLVLSSGRVTLIYSLLCFQTLLAKGQRFFTNCTGFPAQRVFSGSLLPAGTQELGATTTLCQQSHTLSQAELLTLRLIQNQCEHHHLLRHLLYCRSAKCLHCCLLLLREGKHHQGPRRRIGQSCYLRFQCWLPLSQGYKDHRQLHQNQHKNHEQAQHCHRQWHWVRYGQTGRWHVEIRRCLQYFDGD